MRFKSVWFVAFVLICLAALSAREAQALLCAPLTPEEALRQYDVIFSGNAMSMEKPAAVTATQPDGKVVTYVPSHLIGKWRVRTVWKGQAPGTVEIRHEIWGGIGSTPDPLPLPQNHILLVSIDEDGQWAQGYCTFVPSGNEPAFLQTLQRYKARADELDRLAAASPANIGPWLRKAGFLEEHGDKRGAIAAFTRVIEIDAGTANAFTGLARNLFALGRFDDTVDAARKALALRPDDAQAKQLRDHALIKAGRNGEVDFAQVNFSGFRNFGDKRELPLDLSGLKMDGAQFVGAELRKVALADASLRGANLREVRFDNVNLAGADLGRADMEKSHVYQSDLRNARLQSVNLRGASLFLSNLENADLRGVSAAGAMLERVTLSGARLDGGIFAAAQFTQALASGTDFATADLSRAMFKEADLRGANLSRARLEGAAFTGARFDCQTRWPAGFDPLAQGAASVERDCGGRLIKPEYTGAVLEHVKFNDLDLSRVSFARASLNFVQFWNANLEGADFRDSVMGADFRGANLRGADFRGAQLEKASFYGVLTRPADLTGTVFRGVRLNPRAFFVDHPQMTAADFSGADLRGAVFFCSRRPLGFDPGRYNALLSGRDCPQRYEVTPDLRGVDLRNAHWYLADLRNVDLSGADLRGANLMEANLAGAVLERTDLRGARYDERTIWPAAHSPAVIAKERGLVFAKITTVAHNLGAPNSASYTTSPWGLHPEDVNRPPTLRGAPVPVPDLADQSLDGISLVGAWLPGSRMDRASLRDANLDGANLRGASLQSVDLAGATLERALLEGSDLRDARYDARTRWPKGFDPRSAGARLAN